MSKKIPSPTTAKHQKPGRLALVKFVHEDGEEYRTMREEEIEAMQNELVPVFKNGEILLEQTFAENTRKSKEIKRKKTAGELS